MPAHPARRCLRRATVALWRRPSSRPKRADDQASEPRRWLRCSVLMPGPDNPDKKRQSRKMPAIAHEGELPPHRQASGGRSDRKAQSPDPDEIGMSQTGRRRSDFHQRHCDPEHLRHLYRPHLSHRPPLYRVRPHFTPTYSSWLNQVEAGRHCPWRLHLRPRSAPKAHAVHPPIHQGSQNVFAATQSHFPSRRCQSSVYRPCRRTPSAIREVMCAWIIAKSPSNRILTSSAFSSANRLGAAIISRNCFLSRSKKSGSEAMKSSANICSKRRTSPFSADAKKSAFNCVRISRSLLVFVVSGI